MSSNENYPNTVADIASEIKLDIESDSTLTESYIATWIRNNIGMLNNAIGTCYIIDENLELSPCINNDEKDILKWLFLCRYYDRQANQNLGASAYSWTRMEEGDSKFQRVSNNEVAKTFLQLSKQCKESLATITNFYKRNRALPTSLSSATSPQTMLVRVADPHTPVSWPYPIRPPQ